MAEYHEYQPHFMLLSMFLVAIDGIYVKTVHPYTVLYVVINLCNHSIGNLRGRKRTSVANTTMHYGLAVLYGLIAMLAYISLYFVPLPFMTPFLQGIKAFYTSFNLYALAYAGYSIFFKLTKIALRFLVSRFGDGRDWETFIEEFLESKEKKTEKKI